VSAVIPAEVAALKRLLEVEMRATRVSPCNLYRVHPCNLSQCGFLSPPPSPLYLCVSLSFSVCTLNYGSRLSTCPRNEICERYSGDKGCGIGQIRPRPLVSLENGGGRIRAAAERNRNPLAKNLSFNLHISRVYQAPLKVFPLGPAAARGEICLIYLIYLAECLHAVTG